MRPPGDAAGERGREQRLRALQDLDAEPDEREQHGGSPERNEDEAERYDQQHPLARIDHRIGGNHGSNRARGAERRHRGVELGQKVREARDCAAREIEHPEAHAAEPRLHRGTENPERPHVEDEVQPPAVHERVDDERPPVVRIETSGAGAGRVGIAQRHQRILVLAALCFPSAVLNHLSGDRSGGFQRSLSGTRQSGGTRQCRKRTRNRARSTSTP